MAASSINFFGEVPTSNAKGEIKSWLFEKNCRSRRQWRKSCLKHGRKGKHNCVTGSPIGGKGCEEELEEKGEGEAEGNHQNSWDGKAYPVNLSRVAEAKRYSLTTRVYTFRGLKLT